MNGISWATIVYLLHVHCICLPKQVPGCFPDPLDLGLLAEDEPTMYMYICLSSVMYIILDIVS